MQKHFAYVGALFFEKKVAYSSQNRKEDLDRKLKAESGPGIYVSSTVK